MYCGYSEKISKDDFSHLTDLEKKINKTILAFSCHDLKPSEISDEQLSKIADAEKRLGVVLVAVDN